MQALVGDGCLAGLGNDKLLHGSTAGRLARSSQLRCDAAHRVTGHLTGDPIDGSGERDTEKHCRRREKGKGRAARAASMERRRVEAGIAKGACDPHGRAFISLTAPLNRFHRSGPRSVWSERGGPICWSLKIADSDNYRTI